MISTSRNLELLESRLMLSGEGMIADGPGPVVSHDLEMFLREEGSTELASIRSVPASEVGDGEILFHGMEVEDFDPALAPAFALEPGAEQAVTSEATEQTESSGRDVRAERTEISLAPATAAAEREPDANSVLTSALILTEGLPGLWEVGRGPPDQGGGESTTVTSEVAGTNFLGTDVPRGVASSDWTLILAEYEKQRHAVRAVENQPGVWTARNPGQQWVTRFDGQSFLVQPDGANWQWGLDLLRYGFEGSERTVDGRTAVTAEGQRVTYRWDGMVEEWFVNDTRGLEHGFTFNERPEGGNGPLTLDLAVLGGFRPEVLADGSGVRFVDPQGAAVVDYTGLKVWDATGRMLEAAFVPVAQGVRLAVSESDAAYPLTIDPVATDPVAYTLSGGSETTLQGTLIGVEFTPTTDISVTGLGVFDSGSNGLVTSKEVGLWNASSQALLASTTVPSGTSGTLQSGFRFNSIDSLQLTSGTSYIVGVLYSSSNTDLYKAFGPTATPDARLTLTGKTRLASGVSSLTFPSSEISGHRSGANFTFTSVPSVSSVNRQSPSGSVTSATSVTYRVTFTESVTGVDISDFSLTKTGTANGSIASVSASSGKTIDVTVNSVTGDGTLRLDLKSSGTGIQNSDSTPAAIAAGFTSGQTYTVDITAPSIGIGTIAGDDRINASEDDSSVSVSGTTSGADNGQSVTVNVGGVSKTGTVSSNAWSVTLSSSEVQGLTEGSVSVTADVSDLAGNAATQASKAITYDKTAPTVSSVNSSTSNGTYKAGDNLSIQVTFSEAVTVTGTPQLTLETGTTDRILNYATGSGSTSLTFTYTVQSGDSSSDLDYVATSPLALNSGTIKDAAGNSAILTLASPGATNSLGANKALVIDGISPTVSSVNASTSNGVYNAGDPISIQVNFSESVTVTGTPQLTLETGNTDRAVDYASGTGTTSLTFTYTVQSGDTSSDLDYVATTPLGLNGGTIKDSAGNDATLTLANPGATGSLGANKALIIDTTAPVISAVSIPNATMKIGDVVTVTITVASDTDTYTLGTSTVGGFSLSGLSKVSDTSYTASFTVASGGTDVAAGSDIPVSVVLNDSASNANTAFTTAISQNADRIDAMAPTVTDGNISISGSSGTYKIGDTVTATWNNTSSGDNNSDTISTVTVNFSAFGGGSAVSASNSGNTWTATYTISSGSIDGSNLNVSITATDNAGNATTTSGSTNATVDNVAPTVTDAKISVSGATGAGGVFQIGDSVTAAWNNTSNGDNNSDTISTVTVNFSAFGGGTAVSGSSSGGNWTAAYTITAASVRGSNLNASVTATDNAGNSTTTSDSTNVTVNNGGPSVTDANISISGAGGTSGAFKIGDTVTATWNNTSGGDNNSITVSGVTVDLSQFGGGSAVAASNSSGVWTASYTLVAGSVDAPNRNVAVTATNANASTTTSDTSNATVDNVAPTLTDAKISISGASGTNGAFKIGDTVTATWNNTSSGDNNSDTISTVTVNFSAFGGGTAVSASNSSGTWTATLAISEDGGGVIQSSSLNISVTATDNAGNSTTTGDTSNATLDNHTPVAPANLDLAASSDSGSSGADNITNDNTPTLSGSAEAQSTVELLVSGTSSLGTATADSSGSWTMTATTLAEGTHSITAKAKDSAGNTSTASSALTLTVDTGAPSISSVTDRTINEDAVGTATFTVSDGIASAAVLAVAATSSNTTLLPSANILFGGTEGNRTLAATPLANASGNSTITLTLTDPAGNTATTAFQFTVNAVNDAPVATLPSAVSVNESTNLTFSGLSISDVEGGELSVKLTVTNGVLTVVLSNSVVISAGANQSASLTLTGTVSGLNTVLSTATYRGALNFSGSETLSLAVSDAQGATGSGSTAITVGAVVPSSAVLSVGTFLKLEAAGIARVDNFVSGQPYATAATATLTFLQYAEFSSVSLTNVPLYRDSGQFDGFQLPDLDVSLTAAIGSGTTGLLQLQNARLQTVGFRYQSSQTNGVIRLTATGGTFFPGAEGFAASIEDDGSGGSAAQVSFNHSTSVLSLSAERVAVTVSGAFTLSAQAVTLSYDPNGAANQTLATVATAQLKLLFAGGVSANVSDLILRKDGFSLANGTVQLADMVVGEFANLTAPSLSVQNLSYARGSSLAGQLVLSTTAASIQFSEGGKSVLNVTFKDGTDSDSLAVRGTYDLASRAVELAADQGSVIVPGVIEASASNLTLTYDPNGTANQRLVRLANLQVSLVPLSTSVTLAGLEIRRNGFSVDNASVQLPDVVVGEMLTVKTPTLVFKDVSYTQGNLPSGSLELAAVSATLKFDGGNSFSGAITDGADTDIFGLVGTFTVATQRFQLTLDQTNLTIPKLLTASAPNVVFTFDPNGPFDQVLITLPKLDVILIPLNTGVVVDLITVRLNRISIGNFNVALPDVVIGDMLTIKTPTVSFQDIDFPKGSLALGSLGLSAPTASLKFDADVFLGDILDGPDFDSFGLSGTFTLATKRFDLTFDRMNLSIPGLLNASALNLSFTFDPSGAFDQVVLSMSKLDASLTPLQVDFVLDLFTIRRNGFSIANFSVTLPDVVIGDLLSIKAPTLQFSDINYVRGNLTLGTFGLAAAIASLKFDGGNAFSGLIIDGPDLDGFGLVGTYTLATKVFDLTIDQMNLSIPGLLTALATNVAFRFDPNGALDQIVLSLSKLNASLVPLQTDFVLELLNVRRNGFSIANVSVELPDLVMGDVLTLVKPTLLFQDIRYTTGSLTAGALGLAAQIANIRFDGGAAFSCEISDGPDIDGFGVVGIYSLGTRVFNLTIDKMDLTIPDVLIANAVGIGFVYDPNGAIDQIVFSLSNLNARLIPLDTDVRLIGLKVRRNGFSLDNGSVELPDFRLGGVLDVEGPTLVFENIVYTKGLPLIGTFGLGAIKAVIYPGRPSTALAFDGVDLDGLGILGTYDIVSKTFTLTIDQFELTIPGTLTVDASGVTIRYARLGSPDQIFAIINSAQLTMVSLNMQGTITELKISKNGFKFGSATIKYLGTVRVGNLFTFTGPAVTLTGFGVDYDTGASFDGGITLSADEVRVFPGSPSFTAIGTQVAGTFHFTGFDYKGYTMTVGTFEANIASKLVFTGTNILFRSNPLPGEFVATFGSLGVTLPGIGIGGVGGNFAFDIDGNFVPLENFFVRLTADSSAVNWPSWLPIQITKLELRWPNITLNPQNFFIILSANVAGINGVPATVGGSIGDAVIDVELLRNGKFPIIAIGSASITISGGLYGGTLSGTGFLGIIRRDALGNIVPIEDFTTSIADYTFYGGIIAAYSTAGLSGFELRFGFSELGPLNVFIQATIPVPIPGTNLIMTDFRGGVTFNTELPKITDPLLLRGSAFKPTSTMTAQEWQNGLTQAVINQIKAGTETWSTLSSGPMKIEAGATLYSQGTTPQVFRADLDVVLDTNGKLLLNANLVYGDKLPMRAILYTDLAELANSKLKILFLADNPADVPVVTLRGVVDFVASRTDGKTPSQDNPADRLEIQLTGAVDFQAALAQLTVEGTVALSVSPLSNPDTIDLKMEGELILNVLGQPVSLAGAAGAFHLRKAGDSLDVWGALLIQSDLDFLTKAGITANATTTFLFNATSQTRSETLKPPGRSAITLSLPSKSASFRLEGDVGFAGTNLVKLPLPVMTGVFSVKFTDTSVTLTVQDALLQLRLGTVTLFRLNLDGTARVDKDGFAATFTGSPQNVNSSLGLKMTGPTSSSAMTFTVDVNSTGKRQVLGSKTLAAGVYARIKSTGAFVVGLLRLEADFEFEIGGSSLGVTLTGGQLDLTVESKVILGFNLNNASLLILNDGIVAKVDLSLRVNGLASDFGFKSGADYRLDINTTADRRLSIPANTAQVTVAGDLQFVGGFKLTGTFTLTQNASSVGIGIDGHIELFTTRLSFDAEFAVISTGIYGVVKLPGKLNSSFFDATANLQLQVNTTSGSAAGLSAKTMKVVVTNLSMKIAGATLTGGFSIGVDDGQLVIDISPSNKVKTTLAGKTITLEGYIKQNGDFKLTGETEFDLGSKALVKLNSTLEVEISKSKGVKASFDGKVYMLGKDDSIGSVKGTLNFSNSFKNYSVTVNEDFSITKYDVFNFSGDLSLKIEDGNISADFSGSGKLFGAISMSAWGGIRTASGKYWVYAKTSVSVGDNAFGASGSIKVKLANHDGSHKHKGESYSFSNGISIRMKGSAWGFGRDGATVSIDVNVGTDGVFKVTIVEWDPKTNKDDWNLTVRLKGGLKAWGSDISGGTAFLDVNGNGVLDANEPSTTADDQGNFSFAETGSSEGGQPLPAALQPFDQNRNNALDANEGQWIVQGGLDVNTLAPVTGTVILADGGVVGNAGRSSGRVVYDANRNGLADADEPGVSTDETGAYSFHPFNLSDDLGSLSAYDVNGSGELETAEGQLRVLGGTLPGPISNDLLAGTAPGTGATRVFFDANGNGIFDAGEVSVVPNASGFYSFIDRAATAMDTLGRLRPFDTNRNGVIDPAEGTIVITGGVDKNTGLPVSGTTTVPASALSNGLQSTVNPLTGLLSAAQATGKTANEANTVLQAAFGMPPAVQVSQFDPRTVAPDEVSTLAAVLAASSKMNHLGYVAASLLGTDEARVRQALESEIARRIASMSPRQDAGNDVVQFDLSDAAVIDSLLASVQSASSRSITSAQRGAVAAVLGELNRKVDQVLAGNGGDPIANLAPLKAIAQTSLPDLIRKMMAGEITPEQLVTTGIAPLLASQEVPVHIGQVADQVLTGTQVAVPLFFQNTNSISNPYTVIVAVDNAELLPESAVVLTGSGNNRVLALTPSLGVSGAANVTIRARLATATRGVLESTESFVVTSEPVNTAPTISSVSDQTAAVGGAVGPIALVVGDAETSASLLQVWVTASDPTLLPSSGISLSGNGATRTLTLTPVAGRSGAVDVIVQVSDGFLSRSTQFVLNVVSPEVAAIVAANDPPSFAKGSDQEVLEGAGSQSSANWASAISPGPSDESGQMVQFLASNDNHALFSILPAISSAGQLTYAIAPDAFGSATVTVQLRDNGGTASGGSDTSEPVTFVIRVLPVNDVATFTKGGDQLVVEDSGARIVPNWATHISRGPANESNQNLTFVVSNDFPSLFISQPSVSADGTLTFTSRENAYGSATVTVVLKDDGGTSNGGVDTSPSQTFSIVLHPINDEPTIDRVADRVVAPNSQLSIPIVAKDIDGDRLTYSLAPGAPVGASIDSVTGVFRWVPDPSQGGRSHLISIRAADGGSPNLVAAWTFSVEVLRVNMPPTIARIADQVLLAGQTVRLRVSATDSDTPAAQLKYALDDAPEGASLNSTTGEFSWTPTDRQSVGMSRVTVRVSDNGAPRLSATASFNIEVRTAPNTAPILAGLPNKSVLPGTELEMATLAVDRDIPAQTITWSLAVGAPKGMMIDPVTGLIRWRVSASEPPGAFPVTVIATDNGAPRLSTSRTFVVDVLAATPPPSTQNVYFQHEDGSIAYWGMNGMQLASAGYLEPVRPAEPGWKLKATADFDNDGETDLLLQKHDGSLAVWFMNGAKLKSGAFLGPGTTGDSNWQVVGADDFNGDSKADVLFRHGVTGTLAAWLMDGLTLLRPVLLSPSAPGQDGWHVVGTGDFNSDEKADLAFQHSDGRIAFWLMDRTTLVSGRLLESQGALDPSWQVRGVVDLNSDSHLDLLVQTKAGAVAAILLKGASLLTLAALEPSQVDPAWEIAGP